jgi:hypothetical protein
MLLGREADNLPLSHAEVKNILSYGSPSTDGQFYLYN